MQDGANGDMAPATPFTFTATGAEYFRIWIVNTALSLVTLGFYTPWALVRKRQYFYGNTHFRNETFSFLGRPVPILIGYLMVLGVTAVFQASSILAKSNKIWYAVFGGALLAWVLLIPYLVRKSIQFRTSTAQWNGLRFGHRATLGQSYGLFLWRALLVYISFGFYLPAWDLRRAALLFGGLKWGNLTFAFKAKLKDYWVAYLILWGVSAMAITIFFGAAFAVLMVNVFMEKGAKGADSKSLDPAQMVFLALFMAGYLVLIFIISALWKSLLFKTNWNAVTAGPLTFACKLSVPKFMLRSAKWYSLTVLTLGFYRPWAQVEQTRMLLESLTISGDESEITQAIATALAEQNAMGGAVGEVAVENAGFEVGF